MPTNEPVAVRRVFVPLAADRICQRRLIGPSVVKLLRACTAKWCVPGSTTTKAVA